MKNIILFLVNLKALINTIIENKKENKITNENIEDIIEEITMDNKETNFDKIMEHIFKWEGGYVNHPNDPGGETNFGISKRAFNDVDIKNLTKEKAKDIYRRHYWNKIKGDKIKDLNVALQIMDFAVNAGVRRSVRFAQQILEVVPDGIIGPLTLNALNMYNSIEFVEKFTEMRKQYYKDLVKRNAKFKVFLKGWLNRTNDCKI